MLNIITNDLSIYRAYCRTSELKTSTAIAEYGEKNDQVDVLGLPIILALLTFTRRSEARPLNPIVEAWNIPNKSLQPILVGAKAIVNMGLELKMSEKRQMYESNRVSPGGPDPWHHSMEHDAEQTAIDSLASHACLKSSCKAKRHQ